MKSWNLQKIKNSIQSNQYLPYVALILITLLLYTCSPIYLNERGNVDIDTSFAVSNAMRHGYVQMRRTIVPLYRHQNRRTLCASLGTHQT